MLNITEQQIWTYFCNKGKNVCRLTIKHIIRVLKMDENKTLNQDITCSRCNVVYNPRQVRQEIIEQYNENI